VLIRNTSPEIYSGIYINAVMKSLVSSIGTDYDTIRCSIAQRLFDLGLTTSRESLNCLLGGFTTQDTSVVNSVQQYRNVLVSSIALSTESTDIPRSITLTYPLTQNIPLQTLVRVFL
jgi:hypothetical protein